MPPPPMRRTRSTLLLAAAALLTVAGLAQLVLCLVDWSGEAGDVFQLVLAAVQFVCGLIAFILTARRRPRS